MAELDIEFLITLIQDRPMLWDKTLDSYKDRNVTKKAWQEISIELSRAQFDALDDKGKTIVWYKYILTNIIS